MTTLIGSLAGVVGVVITGFVTYLLGKRGKSGRVDTTEAATLWAEAEKLRDAYRLESHELRQEVANLRNESLTLRTEVVTLRNEILTVREEAHRWKEEADELRKETAAMRVELDKLGKPYPFRLIEKAQDG